ncbi:MAG TPA: hypothetical protein VMB71_11205 [Acetobacteraceae bacterium]|nr:hypothetical protein [Acetobacteraceae bacterium]
MLRTTLLAACLTLAGGSAAFASSFNVSLDGFCNTFALTVSGFEVYGSRSGCGYTVIDGGTVGKVGSKYTISNDTNDQAEIFTWYFTKAKHGAGNWYLYESTASSQSEINSGTYTVTGSDRTPRGTIDVTRR